MSQVLSLMLAGAILRELEPEVRYEYDDIEEGGRFYDETAVHGAVRRALVKAGVPEGAINIGRDGS